MISSLLIIPKNIFSKPAKQSLKRLKRETIDYYQLHSARVEHLQNGECIEAMDELQKQGKIRYWGLSLNTFDPFPEAEVFIETSFGKWISTGVEHSQSESLAYS